MVFGRFWMVFIFFQMILGVFYFFHVIFTVLYVFICFYWLCLSLSFFAF